jgi:hypothetical protein
MANLEGFQSGRGRAWFASAGIVVSAFFTVVFTLCELVEHFAFPDWETSEELSATLFAITYGTSGVTWSIALVLAAVGYLVWIHRAAKNTFALGFGTVGTTPGTAVWCWFIPFVNLFKPYHVVGRIYRASDPDQMLSNDLVARWPKVLSVWWGAWVISSIIGNISIRLSLKDDPALTTTGMWLDVVDMPFTLVAAGTAIAIIWSIEARQQHLAERAAPTSVGGSPQHFFPHSNAALGE